MKAVIHYYSATGNTARAAGLVEERLKAAGWEVAMASIAVHSAPPEGMPELTVLAFPVWAWAPPHFVLDYARRLPQAKGARAAVLSVCGGFGAQAAEEAERTLRSRGYEVACSGEAVYPDNWTLAMGPPTGEALEKALERGDGAARAFAEGLLSESPPKFRCGVGHKAWSWPISILFRTFGRRFLGKAFAADDRCTGCGWCASTCPVRAIRMEGIPVRPRWNASCAGCYRCINLCPEQAIQISVPLLAIHLGTNLAATVTCLGAIGWIHRQLATLPGWAAWAVAAALAVAGLGAFTILQLTAGDAVLHGLATRAGLRGFFLRNYTKRFGRYRAPGFKPGKISVLSR